MTIFIYQGSFGLFWYIFAIFSMREKTLFEISAIQPGRADGKDW
jgi:hypothetical protein